LPIAAESDQELHTTTLRAGQSDAEATLVVPSGVQTQVVLVEVGLVGLQSLLPPSSVSLIWEGGQRQLGTVLSPPACSDFRTVYYPDICRTEVVRHDPREEVVLASQLFVDESATAWVAAVLTDLTETCSWTVQGGCFETLPCQCQQVLSRRVGPTWLVLERVTEPASSVRIALPPLVVESPWGIVQAPFPLAVGVEDGTLWVAVGDGDTRSSTVYAVRVVP
jgi:hypothetical protein